MALADVSTHLAVLGGVLLAILVASRFAGLAAQLGIWISRRVSGPERLYGDDRADGGRMPRHGRARTALAPRGKVFVSGELWDAETAEGERPVAAGERVEVLARDGLLLRVRARAEDESA